MDPESITYLTGGALWAYVGMFWSAVQWLVLAVLLVTGVACWLIRDAIAEVLGIR